MLYFYFAYTAIEDGPFGSPSGPLDDGHWSDGPLGMNHHLNGPITAIELKTWSSYSLVTAIRTR